MNILIIEDEEPAAARLEKLLKDIEPSVNVIDTIVSVKSAVKFFKENDCPDLALMDIQLADGVSFDIFKEIQVDCPIIFITAFNQYAIDAFKLNSVDYLLKPVKKEELAAAINKFKKNRQQKPNININDLVDLFSAQKTEYQKRLIVRFGEQIKAIEIDNIAYFFVENKITYLFTKSKLQYPVDHNLDELEKIIDPHIFYRINRQFIINIHSIEKMVTYSKARVKLTLNPPASEETIVSAERSAEFKIWLLGNK